MIFTHTFDFDMNSKFTINYSPRTHGYWIVSSLFVLALIVTLIIDSQQLIPLNIVKLSDSKSIRNSSLQNTRFISRSSLMPALITKDLGHIPEKSVKSFPAHLSKSQFSNLAAIAFSINKPTEPSFPNISFSHKRNLPASDLNEKTFGKKHPQEPPFHQIILQAADRHQVDPALIRAIIFAESGYNPKAVSNKGAKGLMQLMPRTAQALGVKDPFNPKDNINGGVYYFKQLLCKFNGKIDLALAAYNAGRRNVIRHQGIPPFPATKKYIKKVVKYYQLYKHERNS